MGKVTKICDFDRPESPTEMIVRGLKIALSGAKKENDFFEDVKKSIQEDLAFTIWEMENRKLRTKYESELVKATKNKAFIFFKFKSGVATEIEISGLYANHVSAIGNEIRTDIKRAVKEWVEMEAQARGEKAKKHS